uniref:Uncharacterized protein n=1 Tax=Chromera velia CCMP2878 TaxID=1169474 RepID=A0A0G4GNB3_9ALVE|eukprot:Cvel_4962.t1-p1 / transcript=Cvel_4962.t1 / gene=Cvel_4962 / organism=Chromera_velia_CCMP2878 / gene_product=hypothetical protein / transcript_product=hypothetical protein / location=Cvel_scaffold224:75425-77549(-) / protein_length=87 / sequence_SO=supercontig / SO=protein_coding / is_pseudo=false
MSVDSRVSSVMRSRFVLLCNSRNPIATIWARLGKDRGYRCFGDPLGSLGITSPPRSTGVDGGLGGASRLCASICMEPDGVLPGVSLQ